MGENWFPNEYDAFRIAIAMCGESSSQLSPEGGDRTMRHKIADLVQMTANDCTQHRNRCNVESLPVRSHGAYVCASVHGCYVRVCNFHIWSAGVWWLVFSSYTFRHLKARSGPPLPTDAFSYITFSWYETWVTLKHIKSLPTTFKFTALWFIMSDGAYLIGNVGALMASSRSALLPSALAFSRWVCSLLCIMQHQKKGRGSVIVL